tara:strand:- start:1550 stop:1750 length:201 start_codon:yes stop_codon:yes gene_type:complete
MAYEHKNNTFTLFYNEGKEKEIQPDFTGQGKIGDKDVEVAGWKKTSQNGKEYISFKVAEKEDKVPF